jgi:uncharacterized protein Usg
MSLVRRAGLQGERGKKFAPQAVSQALEKISTFSGAATPGCGLLVRTRMKTLARRDSCSSLGTSGGAPRNGLESIPAADRRHGLTTAEIHYRMPDHPRLLQLYLWQEYDLAPDFPALRGFLDFWSRELEGALHSVRIAHNQLVRPSEWKAVDGVFRLN